MEHQVQTEIAETASSHEGLQTEVAERAMSHEEQILMEVTGKASDSDKDKDIIEKCAHGYGPECYQCAELLWPGCQMCPICCFRPQCQPLEPCGHNSFCRECAVQLSECPMCKGKISKLPPLKELHLVSWNVAGWKTTLQEMDRTLSLATTAKKRSLSSMLSSWLESLSIDVLCLQEVKTQSNEVAESAAILAETDDFESFWACNDGGGNQRKGLNGVSTWARKGQVLRADKEPLGHADLDNEGRCLVTEHSAFVLFNIYAPNASSGSRIVYKRRWLQALRLAMHRERKETAKPIILAGDINHTRRIADQHWSKSHVHVESACTPQQWEQLSLALETRRVIEVPGIGACVDQTKFRIQLLDKYILGMYYDTHDDAWNSLSLEARYISAKDGSPISFPDEDHCQDAIQIQESGFLNIQQFSECLRKVCGVALSDTQRKKIVFDDRERRLFNKSTQAKGQYSFFDHQLISEDKMVDTFAQLHPGVEERFTCWNQHKNERYANIGARIDAIYVDADFFFSSRPIAGALDSSSGLIAATLNGRFRPAPFIGSGIPDASPSDYLHHCNNVPKHTGIIYTPPSWSDHAAVSLLLTAVSEYPSSAEAVQSSNDRSLSKRRRDCRACQPQSSVNTIKSYFQPVPKGESRTKNNATIPPPSKKPRNDNKKTGILRFFQPRAAPGGSSAGATSTEGKGSGAFAASSRRH